MTQKGKVVSVNGGIARVRVIRRSACDGCRQKSMCSGMSDGCAEQQPLEADAKNTAGAVAGDEVIVETKSETVLFLAFSVFILPIVSAIAAYFAAECFCLSQIAVYVVSAVAFFVSAALSCFLLNRKMKKKLCIEIVKIIEKDNENL